MLTRAVERSERRAVAALRPGLFGRAFRRFDACLRRRLGIFEFADDGRCVLRLSVHEARRTVRLSDGVCVRAGDRVGELHLWNEQLPPMERGADVAWAAAFRRRFADSLGRLADYVERRSNDADIAAFRMRTMVEGWGGEARLPRVARRLGFEPVDSGTPGAVAWVLSWGGSLLMRGLLLAFNPAAIRGRQLHRRPQEFWISRDNLRERYGKKRREDIDT